jgi:anti-anti-sigma factor
VELPISRVRSTGQAQTDELTVPHPDGTQVTVERIVAPLFDDQGGMSSAVIVLSDLSARKRAEQEQRSMRDELIRAQAAALAERSTPLIPITDEILVMPLVGSLDTERSQQLLDVLLTGVSKGRVRAAILDITGVRMVDTQAAGTLTQAAQALRLLGVHPVLTGIRAEVAQTLVSLGLPLTGIISLGTLQDGIAYASKLMGHKDASSPAAPPKRRAALET